MELMRKIFMFCSIQTLQQFYGSLSGVAIGYF